MRFFKILSLMMMFISALTAEYFALNLLTLFFGGMESFSLLPLSEIKDSLSLFGLLIIAIFSVAIGSFYRSIFMKILTTIIIAMSIVISLVFQLFVGASC